jgi:metal-responsive CopG/Arc/MetJ family transcriptional regulator
MRRLTITIDEDLVAELERYMAAHGYTNRSGAALSETTRTSVPRARRLRCYGYVLALDGYGVNIQRSYGARKPRHCG